MLSSRRFLWFLIIQTIYFCIFVSWTHLWAYTFFCFISVFHDFCELNFVYLLIFHGKTPSAYFMSSFSQPQLTLLYIPILLSDTSLFYPPNYSMYREIGVLWKKKKCVHPYDFIRENAASCKRVLATICTLLFQMIFLFYIFFSLQHLFPLFFMRWSHQIFVKVVKPTNFIKTFMKHYSIFNINKI